MNIAAAMIAGLAMTAGAVELNGLRAADVAEISAPALPEPAPEASKAGQAKPTMVLLNATSLAVRGGEGYYRLIRTADTPGVVKLAVTESWSEEAVRVEINFSAASVLVGEEAKEYLLIYEGHGRYKLTIPGPSLELVKTSPMLRNSFKVALKFGLP